MRSPFPGMDPYVEKEGIFHELHVQFLAEAQRLLQPQLRPKYIAKIERRLGEHSVWEMNGETITLERKQPDVSVVSERSRHHAAASTAVLARPTISVVEELSEEELDLRKQRRIVIYVNARPRLAVASIELLSPSNKNAGSVGEARYLEKRGSALHGGIHWIEIDLLRAGRRPPLPMTLPDRFDYLAYIAQAVPDGWNHQVYAWTIRDPLPVLAIPLLAKDRAMLDMKACFRVAYEGTAADTEANYRSDPPAPPLSTADKRWVVALLRKKGLRK